MIFEVQSAGLVAEVPEQRDILGLTPSQQRGLKYQAKVEKTLEALLPGRVLLHPWFRYKANYVVRRCQPDMLIFSPEWREVTIVEVKYSTVIDAWTQLQLYKPVVAKAYRIPVSLALITRVFDPAVGFPTRVEQLEGLERLGEWRATDALAVVSWKESARRLDRSKKSDG